MSAATRSARAPMPPFLATAAGVTVTLLAFAGFAKTYYLKRAFDGPALPSLVHLHGLVMTLWLAVFLIQAELVRRRRLGLHVRIGQVGAGVAGIIVVASFMTAVSAAGRGVSPGPPPLVFLVIPLGDIAVFAILAGAGLALRSRGDTHGRLMTLSCLSLLPPAVARLPLDVVASGSPFVFYGLADLVAAVFVAIDTVRHRRLHPAFALGLLLLVGSQLLRGPVGESSAWGAFAEWLCS